MFNRGGPWTNRRGGYDFATIHENYYDQQSVHQQEHHQASYKSMSVSNTLLLLFRSELLDEPSRREFAQGLFSELVMMCCVCYVLYYVLPGAYGFLTTDWDGSG